MKLYKKILLLICLCTIPVMGTYGFYFFSSKNVNNTFTFKDSLLKERSNSNKLIIIGGSNAPHGYDSEQIEKCVSLPVVNTGISAAFGLEFYLNWIKPYLIPEDVIILSLEYELLHSKQGIYGSYEYIWLAYSYPDFFRSITTSKERLLHFFSYSITYLLNMKGYLNSDKRELTGEDLKANMVGSWNLNGDRINLGDPIFLNYDVHLIPPDQHFKNLLRPFMTFCDSNNIEVFINFPPLRKKNVIQKVSSKNMVNLLKEEFPSIIILNNPNDGFFEDGDIHDSPYHLTSSAKAKYTSILCSNLVDARQ